MANKKRLIDANVLITAIQGTASNVAKYAPYDPEWFTRLAARQVEIIYIIDEAPTVDAVEVVHAVWVEVGDGVLIDSGTHFECSECRTWTSWGRLSNYCPNCGAKMNRGEEI